MPLACLQILEPVLRIEGVHLQRGDIDEKTRTDELLVLLMFAQNVAHVLAQEAFDALAKFLDAVDVFLLTFARCHPAHRAVAA